MQQEVITPESQEPSYAHMPIAVSPTIFIAYLRGMELWRVRQVKLAFEMLLAKPIETNWQKVQREHWTSGLCLCENELNNRMKSKHGN